MEHQKVRSSNIASVAYADGVLEVIFSNGGHYRYTGETAERHYQALMAAHADEKQSVGTYFARNVRHDKALKTAKVERK